MMSDLILEKTVEDEKFFSKKTGIHLFGYSLVGAISNIIEMGTLFVLVEVLHFWYLMASIIVFTFGSTFSFIFRRRFVFKKRGFYEIRKQFASYLFIFLINISLNSFIMTFCVSFLKIHYVIAYFMSVLITGIAGFLWNKIITFKK